MTELIKTGVFLKSARFSIYRNYCMAKQALAPARFSVSVFYDHACPLCRTEMLRLKQLDKQNLLNLIDISVQNFSAEAWGVEAAALGEELHVLDAKGEWHTGMAAIRGVYNRVGLGWLVFPTALPGLSRLFEFCYGKLAPNRSVVSRWLGLVENDPCRDGICNPGNRE